jgi:hypothetical protein
VDNSITGVEWASWYAETVEHIERMERLRGTEPHKEPYEPPRAPPTFTWGNLPPEVLATVLDPQSSPEGVRLAMGTAAYIKREMMVHKSRVALLGIRAMADMAGIHKDTVAKAVARQATIVRVGNGTPLVIENGHGDSSGWSLVAMDDPMPITLPVDPHNGYDLIAVVFTEFFDPAHRRWSTKMGGMTSRSYWLVLALLLTHGAAKVTVTTTEAAALIGAERSTASRTLADIVTHLDGDARRTTNGLEVDLCQMLAMDWGGDTDRDKEAARRAERAKWLDEPTRWATRDAREYLAAIRSEPRITPEVVAWVESHTDEVVANFRKGYVRDDPPPTAKPKPTPADLELIERVRVLREKVMAQSWPT